MAMLEIEGAERGWLATAGTNDAGDVLVREALSPEVELNVQSLIQALLEEPFEGGLLGSRRGEDLLYALATTLGRRRPLLGAERVFGHVRGGSRFESSAPPIPGWDEA
jgi:hypothetical protein